MDSEKHVVEQLVYNDEIPDPEEEAPPRDDVPDAFRIAAHRRKVAADEDIPNDCFSEKML